MNTETQHIWLPELGYFVVAFVTIGSVVEFLFGFDQVCTLEEQV